jgi:hypothetical protein
MEIDNPGMGAASIAMSFGAKPKLLFIFRWWAVLMGLASIAAALPVGAFSFGCDGATKLLLRVCPLRDAYKFLFGAYGRVIDRLGQEVLWDPRDSNSSLDICMGTLQNLVGRLMCVFTIERTADQTILATT